MNKASREFEGDNRLLLGIILGVITFWLFAQTLVNLVVPLQSTYQSDIGTINIAVSLTALMSGLFIVGAGDFADKFGRVKVTYIGYYWFFVNYYHAIYTIFNCWKNIPRVVCCMYYASNTSYY